MSKIYEGHPGVLAVSFGVNDGSIGPDICGRSELVQAGFLCYLYKKIWQSKNIINSFVVFQNLHNGKEAFGRWDKN